MIFSPKEAFGLCAERLPSNDGYTYTLTTLLGVFLREAESRYGPRDRAWTPLELSFMGTFLIFGFRAIAGMYPSW